MPRLRDSLPVAYDPETHSWGVQDLPQKPHAFRLFLEVGEDVGRAVNPVRAKAGDVGNYQAQKFVDLLKAGVKPGEAAHRLHTNVSRIMSKEQTQAQVRELIEGFTLDAKVRALLVRAVANKELLALS